MVNSFTRFLTPRSRLMQKINYGSLGAQSTDKKTTGRADDAGVSMVSVQPRTNIRGTLNRPIALSGPVGGRFWLTRGSVPGFFGAFKLRTGSTILLGLLLALPLTAGARTTHHHRKTSKRSSSQHRESAYTSSYEAKLNSSAVTAIPESSCLASAAPLETRAGSLYDSSTAQAPSSFMGSLFGPRSSKYRYDSRMMQAAQIAADRARSHSIRSCWRYVKTALVEANVVQSYPKTAYAKQAGDELSREHGFKRLPIRDPFLAPVGSVLVYGGRGAGHVEIRTQAGFASDFVSQTPSKRPLLGIFVKPS